MTVQAPNEYVSALKRNGAGDDAVIAILRNVGWPEKEAVAALASYYDSLTGLAPPARPRSVGGPREAFLHLLSFVTLALWSFAAGSLWFILIELWFPDPAAPQMLDPRFAMAWHLAAVLVAFPVFALVMRMVWRELLGQPEQADSAIRRWLTYLALLLTAATLIGDLLVLVEHLLRGEISAPFAAKVAVVLILAGGIFWFFLRSVQPAGEFREERLRRVGLIATMGATGIVVLTLVLSFVRFGSPSGQRLSSFDDRRSEDLEAIARVIHNRWVSARGQEAPTLPRTLPELPESTVLRLNDPASGERYAYLPEVGSRYQLCANFQTDTTRSGLRTPRSLFRVHPAGRFCFAADALSAVP